jgi:3-oxoacyl-[acyl-carrier protein] reductase
MDTGLKGRHALVCGSTQGIGRACAAELAHLGASVTLLARNIERLKAEAAALPRSAAGQEHHYLAADFTNMDAVREVCRAIGESGRTYSVLVNNTGGPAGGPITEATEEAFVGAFRAHLVANQMLTQAVLGGMKGQKYGRIINIISTSVKAPIPGLGVSNTIRAAVANWAKTLAGEVGGHGITVNNVLPGYTDTERLKALINAKAQKSGQSVEAVTKEMLATIPAGRLGKAEEIAAAVAFLASPAAAYINGINLPVDGGRLQSL